MPESPERFAVHGEDVAAKVIDGEAIIINFATGVYYSIEGVGARMWSLLEAHHDVDAVAEAIALDYDVSVDDCRADAMRFTRQLIDEGLLRPTDDTPADLPLPETNGRLRYESPELHIYRDMGDLLALDPPVPGFESIPWDDPTREAG